MSPGTVYHCAVRSTARKAHLVEMHRGYDWISRILETNRVRVGVECITTDILKMITTACSGRKSCVIECVVAIVLTRSSFVFIGALMGVLWPLPSFFVGTCLTETLEGQPAIKCEGRCNILYEQRNQQYLMLQRHTAIISSRPISATDQTHTGTLQKTSLLR